MERTAMKNLDDMLIGAYTDSNKKLDVEAYLAQRGKIEKAIAPQFISASLKYLSGSEQIKSMVEFLTGYNSKGEARWDKGKDLASAPEAAEKYFRENSIKYLLAQTPAQLLGLRSDYQKALMKHLESEYKKTGMEDWSEDYITERTNLMAELADIPHRYSDLSPEDAEEKRAQDMENLRNRMVGAQFKQLLDSKGKLNQIYRTRRSGAANNAKDWVREWLDLDNEVLITMRLEEDKKRLLDEIRRERQRNPVGPAESDPSTDGSTHIIYDETKRAEFIAHIEDLWDSLKDVGEEVFYNESAEYIRNELGAGSFIEVAYKKFRKDNPYADGYELRDFLKDLFSDSDNY